MQADIIQDTFFKKTLCLQVCVAKVRFSSQGGNSFNFHEECCRLLCAA